MKHRDLERLRASIAAADKGPTEQELVEAPGLVSWAPVMRFMGELALSGPVIGHPTLETTLIVTSPLIRIAPDRTWARTLSRWYQLGRPVGDPDLKATIAAAYKAEVLDEDAGLEQLIEASVEHLLRRFSR